MEPTVKLEQPTRPEMQELLRRATPGPWRVRVGDEGWMHIVGPDRQDITDIGDMEDITTEDAWNGKLIAAAPDLARLALSLHDQLQQEREARERVEVALSWYADVIARKLALNAELPGS